MAKAKSDQGPKRSIELQRDSKGRIWSHIRQKWLMETPEESVRQDYVCTLVNEYGFVAIRPRGGRSRQT